MDAQSLLLKTTSRLIDDEKQIQQGLYELRTMGRLFEAEKTAEAQSDFIRFVRPAKSKKVRFEYE